MATAPVMTVGKAVSMLRSAIVNARIYPKGSQMVESAIKGAHQALESCLQESSPIVVSDLQGKLCANGKEIAEARDFRPFMVQQEVQSLKFLKGLELREVVSLVDALGKRKGQLGESKNLEEWLKAEKASHIQAEEVEFVDELAELPVDAEDEPLLLLALDEPELPAEVEPPELTTTADEPGIFPSGEGVTGGDVFEEGVGVGVGSGVGATGGNMIAGGAGGGGTLDEAAAVIFAVALA